MARSYVNQGKLLGVPRDQLIKMPSFDDAKGMGELYNRLGRPETHDKYQLAPPQGQQWSDGDKAFQAAILPALHEAGVSQKGLEKIVGAWEAYAGKVVKDLDTTKAAAVKQSEDALRAEWGNAFDQNVNLALGTLRQLGQELKLGDQLAKDFDEVSLAARPALAKLLVHIGTQFLEPGTLTGRAAGGQLQQGAAEARQEIAKLRGDAQFMAAYQDKAHLDHKQAVARMEALYQAAHPEAA